MQNQKSIQNKKLSVVDPKRNPEIFGLRIVFNHLKAQSFLIVFRIREFLKLTLNTE